MRFPVAELALVAAAVAAATALTVAAERPLGDGVFFAVLLASALLVAHLLLRSGTRLRRLRRHERVVANRDPQEVARLAVETERARISAEIDQSVRRSLHRVSGLARSVLQPDPQDTARHNTVLPDDLTTHPAGADPDPRPAMREIQDESRGAMAELRRQLGLIAQPPDVTPDDTPDGSGERSLRPDRRDVLLVTTALLVMTLDELMPDEVPFRLGSWLATCALAATLLYRRSAPVWAALTGALVLVFGMATGLHVSDGFAYPLICGLLLWGVLSLCPTPVTVTVAGALLTAALVSRWANDPENGPINVVILTPVAIAAHLAGRLRRARASSARRVVDHEQRLDTARRHAVADERRAFARELHDVASHAVSLVAVQAGAAELAWERDHEAARAGVHQIVDTVEGALQELAEPGRRMPHRTAWEDALLPVERLRAAGLDVHLETSGQPPDHLIPTVHRLVQESLTNVLKHAPGARARVTVHVTPDRTDVEIVDDGRVVAPVSHGYGLAGLEDRVLALGGRFTAGTAVIGGFRVHAALPHDRATVHGRAWTAGPSPACDADALRMPVQGTPP